MPFPRLLLACLLPALSVADNIVGRNDNGYGTNAPTATIDVGAVVGKTTSLPNALDTVNQFLGVPFAQSPPERFSPPQAPAAFKEPINATAFKSACIQQFQCMSLSRSILLFRLN